MQIVKNQYPCIFIFINSSHIVVTLQSFLSIIIALFTIQLFWDKVGILCFRNNANKRYTDRTYVTLQLP